MYEKNGMNDGFEKEKKQCLWNVLLVGHVRKHATRTKIMSSPCGIHGTPCVTVAIHALPLVHAPRITLYTNKMPLSAAPRQSYRPPKGPRRFVHGKLSIPVYAWGMTGVTVDEAPLLLSLRLIVLLFCQRRRPDWVACSALNPYQWPAVDLTIFLSNLPEVRTRLSACFPFPVLILPITSQGPRLHLVVFVSCACFSGAPWPLRFLFLCP
jgi:hypothetical protein